MGAMLAAALSLPGAAEATPGSVHPGFKLSVLDQPCIAGRCRVTATDTSPRPDNAAYTAGFEFVPATGPFHAQCEDGPLCAPVAPGGSATYRYRRAGVFTITERVVDAGGHAAFATAMLRVFPKADAPDPPVWKGTTAQPGATAIRLPALAVVETGKPGLDAKLVCGDRVRALDAVRVRGRRHYLRIPVAPRGPCALKMSAFSDPDVQDEATVPLRISSSPPFADFQQAVVGATREGRTIRTVSAAIFDAAAPYALRISQLVQLNDGTGWSTACRLRASGPRATATYATVNPVLRQSCRLSAKQLALKPRIRVATLLSVWSNGKRVSPARWMKPLITRVSADQTTFTHRL